MVLTSKMPRQVEVGADGDGATRLQMTKQMQKVLGKWKKQAQ